MQKKDISQRHTTLLKKAISIMKKGNPVYLPSKYWNMLGEKNIDQLNKDGFKNIKIKQGLDYFQFLVFEWSYWQFQFVWKRSSWITKIRAVLPALTSPTFSHFPMEERQRWLFAYYHYLLWDYVKKIDYKNLLSLPEPRYGNPLLFHWRNHTFTQDLLNSIIETYSILEALAIGVKDPKVIVEVGGGYGRNAYVLKKMFPKSKIVMVDIVPGIVLAQWYLHKVFPRKKVLGISDFNNFKEVKKRYEKADFVFLLPHQIEMLPDKSVDLFININSFQEMTYEQIKTYFNQIARLTTGIFYTKQWKKQHNTFDHVKITEFQYPKHSSWKEIFHRDSRVQSKFFEAAYKIE